MGRVGLLQAWAAVTGVAARLAVPLQKKRSGCPRGCPAAHQTGQPYVQGENSDWLNVRTRQLPCH